MKNKGFTVVEMIIVTTIIGILASLATVQMLRAQSVARDKERADDIKAIMIHFQDIYESGQIDGTPIASGDSSVTTAVNMGYPSTRLLNASYVGEAQANGIIQSIRLDALKSPFLASSATSPNFSLVAATTNADLNNTAKTAGGITLGKTNDVYVYQPLDANGAICDFATGLVSTGIGASATTSKVGVSSQRVIAPRLIDNCVKFNIFYYSEADDLIIKVQSAKSSSDGLY